MKTRYEKGKMIIEHPSSHIDRYDENHLDGLIAETNEEITEQNVQLLQLKIQKAEIQNSLRNEIDGKAEKKQT